ncbi:uncharacterized protein LOC135166775 [Diachasmimorpha longicaudata]|uniref:uncharacterized protein LOC135166775 n=1 Tax=Diachasmimorpha longicaudata TaxID=58733 RepID=UPI0030B8EF5A
MIFIAIKNSKAILSNQTFSSVYTNYPKKKGDSNELDGERKNGIGVQRGQKQDKEGTILVDGGYRKKWIQNENRDERVKWNETERGWVTRGKRNAVYEGESDNGGCELPEGAVNAGVSERGWMLVEGGFRVVEIKLEWGGGGEMKRCRCVCVCVHNTPLIYVCTCVCAISSVQGAMLHSHTHLQVLACAPRLHVCAYGWMCMCVCVCKSTGDSYCKRRKCESIEYLCESFSFMCVYTYAGVRICVCVWM